ncbi:FHA domain-containing protein [Ruegeria arenilitoris]|uniref:FHA domain-containing protein n=1 Tax=Ruegeria arenilitoris TaxID=1173585 RepID=UPI00147B31E0|nr:FHA domain-containing protein [Ruegeria arenilitoris]
MFKYKSPLSRLLEGAGKTKEAEGSEPEVETTDKAEPIADFNALRQALAGGNLSTDSYEETDELIPEEKMPDFAETDPAVEETTESEETAEAAPEAPEEAEQVVTLHVAATEEEEETIQSVMAETAEPDLEEVQEEEASAPTPFELPEPIAVETAPDKAAADAEPVASEPEEAEASPDATEAPASDRRSRVKTTFLGFERPDTHVQELIETTEPVAKTETAGATFPVGWLAVTSGPGRGSSITLTEGLMQIGRNDDQAIQLDFGDTGISRSNHAVIAYDPEDRKCYLGHGGKANLVRLNGKPVLSTVPLSSGDLIRISETSLRFVAFCDENFDWRDA